MLTLLLYVIKRVIFAFLLLYAFNSMGSLINLYIPINILTIASIAIFGFPSLLMLSLYSVMFI